MKYFVLHVAGVYKKMALDFVQLEFFAYGFLVAVWTHDVAWALAGPMLLWFGVTWAGIHREDVDEQQFDFHVYTLITLLLGAWTGVMFVWHLRTPRLFDVRMFHTDDRGQVKRVTPVAVAYVAQIFLITIGGYYLLGSFSDGLGTVSDGAALAAGWSLIVVFSVSLVVTAVVALTGHGFVSFDGADDNNNNNQVRVDRLNLKNMLSLAFFLTASAVYDYLALNGFDTWHGAILLAALVLLYFLFYWYKGYVAWWVNTGQSFFYRDGYLGLRRGSNARSHEEFSSSAGVLWFILFVGGVHFVSMLVGWLVDISTEDGEPVFIVIAYGALTIFWTLLFWLVGSFMVFPAK